MAKTNSKVDEFISKAKTWKEEYIDVEANRILAFEALTPGRQRNDLLTFLSRNNQKRDSHG